MMRWGWIPRCLGVVMVCGLWLGCPAGGNGGGGKPDGGDGGNSDGGPTGPTFTGHVVSKYFGPVAGAKVHVGSSTATTGADGAFTLPSVSGAYDATVFAPSPGGNKPGAVSLFHGVSSATPLFQLPVDEASVSAAWTVDAGGAGIPVAAGHLGQVNVSDVRIEAAHGFISPLDSTTDLSLTWQSDSSSKTFQLAALTYNMGGGGLPSGFDGYAVTTVTATAASNQTQSIPLTAVPGNHHVLTTVGAIDGGIVNSVFWLASPPGALDFVRFGNQTPVAPTNLLLPIIPTWNVAVGVYATRPLEEDDGSSQTIIIGVDAGTTALNVTVPPVLTQLAPASGSGSVDSTTQFSWTGGPPSGCLYEVQFQSSVLNAPTITVWTTGTTAHLPDLTSVGTSLPSNQPQYSWSVTCSSPFTSVDTVVGTNGTSAVIYPPQASTSATWVLYAK